MAATSLQLLKDAKLPTNSVPTRAISSAPTVPTGFMPSNMLTDPEPAFSSKQAIHSELGTEAAGPVSKVEILKKQLALAEAEEKLKMLEADPVASTIDKLRAQLAVEELKAALLVVGMPADQPAAASCVSKATAPSTDVQMVVERMV